MYNLTETLQFKTRQKINGKHTLSVSKARKLTENLQKPTGERSHRNCHDYKYYEHCSY